MLLIPLVAAAVTSEQHSPGEDQLALHRAGAVRRLQPLWSVSQLPWLDALQDEDVVAELAALAEADEGSGGHLFHPNHDPSAISAAADWLAVPLLNKGRLQPEGCAAAERTCAVLARLHAHLDPRPHAQEVGVRILKLQPGARLRPHHGPGGRLVAHLGIRVPETGASLTVAGKRVEWRRGSLIVFDDSYEHSAQNLAEQPRYILHIAFPHPDLGSETAPLASTGTQHFRLDFFANCSVVATNLRNHVQSFPGPLLSLYNRVSDNLPSDLSPCIHAAALPGGGGLRLTAAHGYGTVDVGFTAGPDWVTFELKSLANWHADPNQTHVQFDLMCPRDICPLVNGTVVGGYPTTSALGKAVGGKFQGFRGAEGHYPDSSGWLTISSDWQTTNSMYFAKTGWKLAYTIAPTASLPQIWAAVAEAEGIAAPNKNRARTWYWTGGTSAANLNETIALVKSMGVELIFLGDATSNIGDYKADPARYPQGLGPIRDQIHAAGLQIGLHLISGGTTVCLDQMTTPWGAGGRLTSCKGTNTDTLVSRNHPEIMVPQGVAPRDWYWANSGGTWYCHEQTGDICDDHTKAGYTVPGPGHPIVALPSNPIVLSNHSWSKLGRYRQGGAVLFDGTHSIGLIKHTDEYNFTCNEYYPRAKSEFTLQMVVHPVGNTTSRVQVLAAKPNEWRLVLNEVGKVEWHVKLTTGWIHTISRRVFAPGGAHVVKATHAGGTIKIFTCLLGEDFKCPLGPAWEGKSSGNCTGPLAESKFYDTCIVSTTSDITVGAERNSSGVVNGFDGALEEIFLARLSLENITAHLFACPACGCNNFYLWDYTNPAARAYWANATASLFNEAGAEACQWDGAEFQPSMAGWGFPHSDQTWQSPGQDFYWSGATQQAFIQSKALWHQELAVEMSMSFGGLGEWHGDMTPFADEQTIKGGICVGGDAWHRQMLVRIVEQGLLYNAYNTPVETFHNVSEVDCFLGGLVATGIPPQMTAGTSPAAKPLIPRVKYWLDLYKTYGQATESSVDILHYDDIFLIGMTGGMEPGDHRGLFAGSSLPVAFPADVADNATVLVFCGYQVPSTNISFGAANHSTFTLFGASAATVHMSGGFWELNSQQVTETIIGADGTTKATNKLFPSPQSGQKAHTAVLKIGEYAKYEKTSARA